MYHDGPEVGVWDKEEKEPTRPGVPTAVPGEWPGPSRREDGEPGSSVEDAASGSGDRSCRSVGFGGIKYFHSVERPSSGSSSRTFCHLQWKTRSYYGITCRSSRFPALTAANLLAVRGFFSSRCFTQWDRTVCGLSWLPSLTQHIDFEVPPCQSAYLLPIPVCLSNMPLPACAHSGCPPAGRPLRSSHLLTIASRAPRCAVSGSISSALPPPPTLPFSTWARSSFRREI